MYDYFVAPLRCPNCNTVSAADSSTNMQTHIRDDAGGIEIGVGFRLEPLEVRDQDIVSSGYLSTGWTATDGRVRLLETWRCPACSHENWARVTISATEVVAIEPVILDRPTVESAEYISDSCYIVASRISGIPARELMTGKVDPVRVLFDRL